MTCNYHQDSDWWEVTKEGGMIILSDILSSHVTPRQSMLKMSYKNQNIEIIIICFSFSERSQLIIPADEH